MDNFNSPVTETIIFIDSKITLKKLTIIIVIKYYYYFNDYTCSIDEKV